MTNNYKPFDLEAALRGEPLVTRDGRKVTHFMQSGPLSIDCPYTAYIEGQNLLSGYYRDGTYSKEINTDDDLLMAPKPNKKLWIAVTNFAYKTEENCHLCLQAYSSKEDLLDAYNESYKNGAQIIEIELES